MYPGERILKGCTMRANRLSVVTILFMFAGLAQCQAGTAESPAFAIDMRTANLDALVITQCPATIKAGANAVLKATSYSSNGDIADVSRECTWELSPSVPTGVEVVRNGDNVLLVADPGAPTQTIQVKALQLGGSGARNAQPITVQVQEICWVMVVLKRDTFMGYPGYWFQVASGGPAGQVAPANARWDFYRDGQFNNESGTNIWVGTKYYGFGGKTTRIGLQCVFANGVTNRVYFYHTPDEDLLSTSRAVDLTYGSLLSTAGQPYAFDPGKTPAGLIIIAHGLWNSATTPWVKDMMDAIIARCPAPNVCAYNWEEMADPTLYNTGGRRRTGNNEPWFLTLDDILGIRPYGQAQGAVLADAIEEKRKAGLVDKTKPIHLIGHSAGGFVMGECAQILRRLGYTSLQVTMLDTPKPFREHATGIGAQYQVERYITSQWGGSDPYYAFTGLISTWEWAYGVRSGVARNMIYKWMLNIQPGANYYRRIVLPPEPMANEDAHFLAHKWYQDTVNGANGESDGFNYSRLVGFSDDFPISAGSAGILSAGASNTPSILAAPPVQMAALPDIAMTNWVMTGTVSRVGSVYTFTDTNDAAIYQDTILPIGVQALKLRYQFTSAGDGDFLSVHWGQEPPLYIGLDLAISRDSAFNTEIPLSQYAGQTNRLIIMLTSRGATNAMAVVDSLALTQVDDPDADGLTTLQEQTLGTNPLLADTDGDGLSDAEELNTYHTNPLLSDCDGDGAMDGVELWAGTNPTNAVSVFAMATVRPRTNGVELTWNSQTGRTYRVQRRLDILNPDFDTLASGLTGQVGTMSYTDTTAKAEPKAVYWAQTE